MFWKGKEYKRMTESEVKEILRNEGEWKGYLVPAHVQFNPSIPYIQADWKRFVFADLKCYNQQTVFSSAVQEFCDRYYTYGIGEKVKFYEEVSRKTKKRNKATC